MASGDGRRSRPRDRMPFMAHWATIRADPDRHGHGRSSPAGPSSATIVCWVEGERSARSATGSAGSIGDAGTRRARSRCCSRRCRTVRSSRTSRSTTSARGGSSSTAASWSVRHGRRRWRRGDHPAAGLSDRRAAAPPPVSFRLVTDQPTDPRADPTPPRRPRQTGPVQYKGDDLEAERGPGLGCFRFQVVVLVVFIVLTPLSVAWNWPHRGQHDPAVRGHRAAAGHRPDDHLPAPPRSADRRGRRRPLASGTKTVGELEDEVSPGDPRDPHGPDGPDGPPDDGPSSN